MNAQPFLFLSILHLLLLLLLLLKYMYVFQIRFSTTKSRKYIPQKPFSAKNTQLNQEPKKTQFFLYQKPKKKGFLFILTTF